MGLQKVVMPGIGIWCSTIQFSLSMTAAWPHPIKAVICDIDGLLLDTEPIFVDAMHEATGYPLSVEFHRKLLGRSGFDAAPWIKAEYNLSYTHEEIVERIDVALKSRLGRARIIHGAHELVASLKALHIPLGLATGSNRVNFRTRTDPHPEFFAQFDTATCGDEVSAGKPNPEIFLTCMRKLGIQSPENVLVFEDAPAGVKCANNAGMAVVMVPDKELPVQEALNEFGAKPTVLLRSLTEFDFRAFKFE
jgi:pseudouridine-5'-monophosphatase